MNNTSPIALFVYKRVDHVSQVINALKLNNLAPHSDLYIFSDGPKNIEDIIKVEITRNFLNNINGFRNIQIIKRSFNYGLSKSIKDGINYVLKFSKSIIVLEDDIVPSIHFLDYMNQCLQFYENDKQVGSISGYVYPIDENISEDIFRVKGAECWGWGTWSDRWGKYQDDGLYLLNKLESNNLSKEFNFNNSYNYINLLKKTIKGKNDSWAVKWYASCFLSNFYVLYPRKTFVKNIGFDGSGTHGGDIDYINSDYCVSLITPHKPAFSLVDGSTYIENYFKKITLFYKIRLKLLNKYKNLKWKILNN